MRRLSPLLALLLAACTVSRPHAVAERQDSPGAAADYQAAKRAGTGDVRRAYRQAAEAMRRMPRHSTVEEPRSAITSDAARPYRAWQFLGPGNVGGRTRALLIDPVDPLIMYAAGVSGGVWKSTAGGATWEPVGDSLANIAVNSMAMSPADRNVIYAGTGEGYFRDELRGVALPLRGDGIFVTRDAGATWTQLASTTNEDFHYVNDLAISSHDPSRVYAATRTGVWRSGDGGATWTHALPATVKGGCLDLAWRSGTDGDYLFASCGTFEQATVYRNKNAESNPEWEAVLTDPLMGRTSLAIAPSDPSIVYALSATNEPGKFHQALHSVWRSNSDGDFGSWTAPTTGKSTHDPVGPTMLTNMSTVDTFGICETGSSGANVTMGWYCNTIAVDPVDPERVWAGGVDLFRSDDGGVSWGQASYWWARQIPDRYPYVHADQHAIVFHPDYDGTTNRTVFFANDGGLARTDDALAETTRGSDAICTRGGSRMRFTSLNHNYGVTQFYHGAVFPDGRRFIAGAQDNGTLVGSTDTGVNAWEEVSGGDGGYVAIDPRDPRTIYASAQLGVFKRSTNGRDFLPFQSDIREQDTFLFIAPLALDPSDSTTVWLGGTSLWRTRRSRADRASAPVPAGGHVSAIAISPTSSERVVAGTNRGHILRSETARSATATTEWTAVVPRPGFVSSLTFDPLDPNVLFATYAGFGGTHVWMSIDGGASWMPRDGNGEGTLPDIPVHSLAVDPTRTDRLYLGTDMGVFVSLDRGHTWAVENTGFANAVTETVVVAPGAAGLAVYAFTHGRGAWRAELNLGGPRRRGVRH
ncbi:MAG TPA: hypothetical protein VGF28_10965 [Thermoanaerobaculia bacterium]